MACVEMALLKTQIKQWPLAQSLLSLFLIHREWILHNRTGETASGDAARQKKLSLFAEIKHHPAAEDLNLF